MADVEDNWVDIRIPADHPSKETMTSCVGSEDGFIMYTLADAPEQYFIEYTASAPGPGSYPTEMSDQGAPWPDAYVHIVNSGASRLPGCRDCGMDGTWRYGYFDSNRNFGFIVATGTHGHDVIYYIFEESVDTAIAAFKEFLRWQVGDDLDET